MSAGVLSPLEGEMAAQRSEGVQAGARRLCFYVSERAVLLDRTSTAAFHGTSPSRGEERLP